MAASVLNQFDLDDNKLKQIDEENAHLELKLHLEEKRAIVQTLSAQLTDSAQTRSSSADGNNDDQNPITEQLQQANTELNEASTDLATNVALIKKIKEDIAESKKACRANLVGITPLKHDVNDAKHKLSNHQVLQGRNSVHVPLKDRGYGSKFNNLRGLLVDHITTTRKLRA